MKQKLNRMCNKLVLLVVFLTSSLTFVNAQSQWIWQQEDGVPNTWMAFRKTITISEVPTQALTKIAVDSKYWLWINGKMVLFEGGLARGAAPNATYYDTVDFAPYLKSGQNTIAILSWYWGRTRKMHADSGKGGLYVSADWNTNLNSNSSWKIKLHPAYDPNSGGGGEDNGIPAYSIKFDARNAMGDWTANAWYTVGYDDSSWGVPVEKGVINSQPWGTLVERPIPQWNDRGLVAYPSLTVNGAAIQLPYTNNTGASITVMAKLPFNQQITPFIKLNSTAGKTISIKTDNPAHQLSNDYISKAGVQEFEGFTWFNGHNVRYIIPDGVEIQELKYRWTGIGDMTGTFECSDANLTRLWWMARNTLYICARDSYMDCPDRERGLWIGDVGDQAGSVFYTLDEAGRKLLKRAIDITIAYRLGDVISGLAPGYLSIQKESEFVTQSLQFIDHVVWQYYYNTGDTETMANAYTPILNYLKLWTMAPDGMPTYRKVAVNWIDWGIDQDGEATQATWYYMALKAAKKMAVALNKNDDIAWYDGRMQSIEQAYENKYWRGKNYNTSGKTIEERVSSLAVLSGLADESHYKTLTDEVLFPVRKSSPHMEWLAEEALMVLGQPEKALTRMKEVYNFQIVDNSLTTLYERFGYGTETLGTKNHAWNAPNYVMSRYITGIKATEVAWSTYEVCPTLANLTSFKTKVPTVKGDILVEVQASKTNFNLKLDSPNNTTAIVGIPKTNTVISEVKVGGQTIWKNNAFVPGVSGVSFHSEDDSFLKFSVIPGNWEFNAAIIVDSAPEISFTTPTNNAVITKGKDPITIELNASDDVGVQKVELYLDNQLIGTKTTGPYSWSSSSTQALADITSGDHTLKGIATDTTGKTAETSISISVIDIADIFKNKLMFYLPLERDGIDHSGNNNHATMGSAVTYATGKYGNGAAFSYTNGSYFTSADNVFEYSSETAYTIAFWIKVSNYSIREDILQPTVGRTLLYSNADLSFRCSHQQQLISFNVNDAEKYSWFHVALVIDQRSGQRLHKFYINGKQSGTIAEGYEFETGKPKALGKLIFGAFSTTSVLRNFTGMLDEVYMFNDVLSEAEVKELMNIDNPEDFLSISNRPEFNTLKLFPNPAKETLHIDGAEAVNASVYDPSGRMIKSVTVKDNRLDVSSLAKGVYFIKMKDTLGNSYKSKFIKE